ncbi:hypothetical protein PF003_g23354 [Phytophthora fragariae]|nr:hypothetical protein PF003_g23354 [Phytophthora fragariae]
MVGDSMQRTLLPQRHCATVDVAVSSVMNVEYESKYRMNSERG